MFVTENHSSKLRIMSFWIPTLKFSADSGIPRKSLDRSLMISKLQAHTQLLCLEMTLFSKKESHKIEKHRSAKTYILVK